MNRFVLNLVAGTLAAVALASAVAAPSAREDQKAPLMMAFTDVEWAPLPERIGHRIAILTGDPKGGPYTELRKVPGGTDNPLHSHSSDITNVIISGVWYTGADVASARDFGPGSVVMMPANWVHVSGCRTGSDCVLYQDGKGQFDFKPATQPAAHR